MRILFLSRSLAVGGAERQIVALARGLQRRGHQTSIAVFYGGGAFEEELRADGIRVHHLAKRGRWELASFLVRLARLVRAERPDILHSYIGGNLFSAALKPAFPSVKVVWGVRGAMRDLREHDWAIRLAARVEGLMSPLADAVIANSHAARREAVARGVDGSKIAVIPNGIDCDRFRPDPAGGERLRAEWGIGRGTPVVGMVARLDPVKNHAVFLRSASRVAISCRDVKFVCVGDGQRSYREKVEQLGRELGLGARLTWVGGLKATRAVYSALDVAVLSSDSESFPNVVAEAMACGRPVVATDTGDMLAIVGDAGAVVPPRDPAALAHGVLEMLRRTRTAGDELSGRTRARIQDQFSVDALVNRTELALEQVMKGAQFEQGSPGYAAGDERSTRSARTSA